MLPLCSWARHVLERLREFRQAIAQPLWKDLWKMRSRQGVRNPILGWERARTFSEVSSAGTRRGKTIPLLSPSVNYEEGEEQIQLNQDLAHPAAAPPSLLPCERARRRSSEQGQREEGDYLSLSLIKRKK